MITEPAFRKLLTKHQSTWPVETVPIAHELGINVCRVSGFPDDISGRIYKSAERGGHSGYAIDVNGTHASTRRRFTIAHEIAHLVLHKSYIGEEMYDDYLYRSGLTNALERQANSLAADILMPRHLISIARNSGVNSVSDLAAAFQVSEAAMSIRIGSPT